MATTTYSELVKNEICHLPLSSKQSKFFLKAFLVNNLATNTVDGQETWIVQTHFSFVARFVLEHLKRLYELKNLKVAVSPAKNANARRRYQVAFVGNFRQIVSDLELEAPTDFENNPDLARAFLIGAFLSGGSVNYPQTSNYHLEFQSFSKGFLSEISDLLARFRINKKSSICRRRNKFILYIKKSEVIADVLKFIGLTDSLFQFEDTRIERDFFNNMRRLNNFDVSNLQRISRSSAEMVQMIKAIKATDRFDALSPVLKTYCEIRLKHREISLSELAAKMSERLKHEFSKSNVWHLTNKIKKIYESCA